MRTLMKVILAGAAIAGLAAAGAVAADNSHVLTVRLADGSQAQIRYTGNVAPRVRILSGPQAYIGFAPVLDPFGPASPFAAMRRMSAAMDRQAALMMRAARALPSGADSLRRVDLASLPPGASGYSVVSTISGGKMCTRTTEYSASTAGAPGRILTRSSGDCGPAKTGQPEAAAAPGQAIPATRAPVFTRTGYDAGPRSPSITD